MHLAREHVERDVGERRDRVVVLGDAEHRQRRVLGSPALCGRGVDGGFVDHMGLGQLALRAAARAAAARNASCRAYFFTSLACAAADNFAER